MPAARGASTNVADSNSSTSGDGVAVSRITVNPICEDLIVKALETDNENDEVCRELTREALPTNGTALMGGFGLSGGSGFTTDKGGFNVMQQGSGSAAPRPFIQLMHRIHVLSLSFSNIGQLTNLEGLVNLKVLRLDNNQIKKMENLGHFVNLEKLDLSFNAITKIEGLENVKSLKDLSLYNNAITEIAGLEGCKSSLEILSLGNNQISGLNGFANLRHFKTLRAVAFRGNPVCLDPDYKLTVLAYITGLKYLDHTLVHEDEFVQAHEHYSDLLQEVEETEAVEKSMTAEEKRRGEHFKLLQQANVEKSETLLEDMLHDDVELSKLKMVPGVVTLVEEYRDRYRPLAMRFQETGLDRANKLTECLKTYREGTAQFEKEYQDKSIPLIRQSEKLIAQTKRCAKDSSSRGTVGDFSSNNSEKTGSYKDKSSSALNSPASSIQQSGAHKKENFSEAALLESLNFLHATLLNNEIDRSGAVLQLLNTLEEQCHMLKDEALQEQNQFFRAVENLETYFFTSLQHTATEWCDGKKKTDEFDQDLRHEELGFMKDKEALMTSVTNSHDIHMGRLVASEDECRTVELDRFARLNFSETESHHSQNRQQVIHIGSYVDRAKADVIAFATLLKVEVDDDTTT